MEFYINSKVFNTPFHLYCKEDGSVEKVQQAPAGILDITSREAWLISNLYKFTIPKFPPKNFKRMFYGLVEKGTPIPWHDVMPKERYKNEVKRYVGELKDNLLELDISYYNNCFKEHNELFDSLRPAAIDTKVFLDNCKSSPSVKSFVPIEGFASKVEYDRTSSTTGRLSVKRGPGILTVAKDLRSKLLKSRFGKDGSIYSLDYVSLEPRVLLSLMGKTNIEEDIYSDVAKEMDQDIPRKAIKLAILSRLYGAQESTVEHQLRDMVRYPQDLIQIVDEYFMLEEAKDFVISEYYNEETETLYNYYGRPIKFENKEPYKLLNYFIQSTAVDVALFGFSGIVNRLNRIKTDDIVPVFILHDALILDIKNSVQHLIPKMLKAGALDIKGFEENKFYMTSEKVV